MKIKIQLILFILFAFIFGKANAQYATTHYVAPSPWQYWSNANELVLTTESLTPITVTVSKSDGTLLTTRTVDSSAPDVYRFSGSPWLLNRNPINQVLPNSGLIISANGLVSVNMRNVASDQANGSGGDTTGNTIKGNASLVSFGNEGRGTSFRLGYYRSDFTGIQGYGAAAAPVYSVMAINDGTQISLNGVNLVLLNAGESYVFQTPIGTLLSSNKPVVANSGAYQDAPGGCGDGVVDQVAPNSVLGKDYIIVRGSGTAGSDTNLPEQSTIVASEDATNITVRNYGPSGTLLSTNTYSLALAGNFKSIHHGDAANAYSSSIISSNKPIVVYSGTAQGCEVDMATVLPIGGCAGSKESSTYKFRNYNNGDLPYFGYVLIESATDIVSLNGVNLETLTGTTRFQIGNSGYYVIKFQNTNIGSPESLILKSNARMTVCIVQQGGGFSMSGFFSSFNETPSPPYVVFDNGCPIKVITADSGLEPYQWYLDGVLIPGATAQEIAPTISGNYSVTGTRECGVTAQSASVFVEVCGDLKVEKTVTNGTEQGTVVFAIVATNIATVDDFKVIVNDLLPSGYTYISHIAESGNYNATTGVWNIGSLPVDNSLSLTITASVNTSGLYLNTATISGINKDVNLTNNIDTAIPDGSISITKDGSLSMGSDGIATVGDVINYVFTVKNTGNVSLTNIKVSDVNAEVIGGPIALAVGATDSTTFTATHILTQADIDSGIVYNLATATGTPPTGAPVTGTSTDPTPCTTCPVDPTCVDCTIVEIAPAPAIAITKDGSLSMGSDGIATVGDVINYVFTVKNTGNVSLTNIKVSDVNAEVIGGPIALAVGATDSTTFTATHILTQADIDSGIVYNLATAKGEAPNGDPVTDDSTDPTPCTTCPVDPTCVDCTIVEIVPAPAIAITKDGTYSDKDGNGITNVGDEIKYTFTVTNTGNVTLNNVTVADPNATVIGGPLASLAVGATDSATFTAIHVLTQSDINAGIVYNLATATGTPPIGNPVTGTSTDPTPCTTCPVDPTCPDCTATSLTQAPSIALIKTGVFDDNNGDGYAQVGETITYSFTVTNTGNVPLSNITITDPLPGVIVSGGPIISLGIGVSDSTTFTAVYHLTQADINSGEITNQATVAGTSPLGIIVYDLSDGSSDLEDNGTVLGIEGCKIEVFNAITPNGDGNNDTFYIRGLECYPKNTVEIYNRWGVLVYSADGYNNNTVVFKGISEGRVTVKQSEGLPSGTYYYILKYIDASGAGHDKAGYLHLNNN